jgi:hypothetical protein
MYLRILSPNDIFFSSLHLLLLNLQRKVIGSNQSCLLNLRHHPHPVSRQPQGLRYLKEQILWEVPPLQEVGDTKKRRDAPINKQEQRRGSKRWWQSNFINIKSSGSFHIPAGEDSSSHKESLGMKALEVSSSV